MPYLHKTYKKEALANNAKLTKQLQKYIKREDFTAETVKKVSAAAMSLCMWVRAMDVYGRVAREIEPKKLKLAGAEEAKANALEKLTIAKAELKIVLDNVASLEAQLSSAKRKAAKLEEDANDCVVKLDRAEKLLAGLGNESVRWSAASQVLEKNLKFVIGNIVLAGGFIAYTGAFTAEFRRDLASIWIKEAVALGLETDPAWRIADVLVDPAEVRQWNIWTLPADDLSVENGIMVTRGRRWPLMIDPQGQANRWCRSMGKEKSIVVTKLTDPIYLRKLEACIRNGHALLIENVEEVLDPAIEPVLNKAIFKRGGQLLLRLGTEDVPYSEDFAFYITTKMANPHYLPEVCIKAFARSAEQMRLRAHPFPPRSPPSRPTPPTAPSWRTPTIHSGAACIPMGSRGHHHQLHGDPARSAGPACGGGGRQRAPRPRAAAHGARNRRLCAFNVRGNQDITTWHDMILVLCV